MDGRVLPLLHQIYTALVIGSLRNCCLSDDKVNLDQETDDLKDYRFTKWMSKNVKLQGIPPSAFYSEPHKHLVETSVRFCFIKV
jgi:hypothetical protein